MRSERRASDRRAKAKARRLIEFPSHNQLYTDPEVDARWIGRAVSKTRAAIWHCDCSRCRKFKLKRLEKSYGEEEIRQFHRWGD